MVIKLSTGVNGIVIVPDNEEEKELLFSENENDKLKLKLEEDYLFEPMTEYTTDRLKKEDVLVNISRIAKTEIKIEKHLVKPFDFIEQ